MNRAYSLLDIKSADDDTRTILGIASTPSTDRIGDIVEPTGAKFKLPLPLLWQHSSNHPIGHVTGAKVTDAGIEIIAQIAKGVSEEIDRAWSLIKSGLVRGLSIGFRGLETQQIPKSFGTIFKSWEWLELSAVTIPANQDATIHTVKQFADELQAATGRGQAASDPILPAHRGKSQPIYLRPKDATKVNATEHVAALEQKHSALSQSLQAIQSKVADEGRTKDEAEKEEFKTVKSELESINEELKDARETERLMRMTAMPVQAATMKAGDDARTPSMYRAPVQVKRKVEPGAGLFRMAACRWAAAQEGRNPADIAKEQFGDTPEVEMLLRSGITAQNWVSKATVAAGTTTSSTWAAPLVVAQNLANEFLEYLRPKTILGRIPGLRMVPFNITVPRQLTETTGYWVGQGDNKPVSAATFDQVTLTFHKLAGISVISEELARFSSPSAEATVRESLTNAIIYRMDRDLLDPSIAAVTGVNPASLTNNVTPTAATGTTADAFRDDMGTMLGTYLQNNMSTSGVVLIMTEDQALKLSLLVNTLGQQEFPNITSAGGNVRGIPVVTSQNIVSTGGSPTDGYPIIAVNAPSILVADEGGVTIDISREAALQMNDAPDSPESASTILVSLWQRNLVGIKAERFVTWTKGRTQAVQYISFGRYQ